MSTNAETPSLAGIRVLDFTQNLPGPYATMLLAGLGAEVIKVEPRKGDTARGVGRFFDLVNGGKKSVVVDLKDGHSRDELWALLPSVDVIVEGFRPGVMDELGFGPEEVRAAFPSIVYCSISAYGQHGPYRDRPAHDINLQALTGACDLSRDEAEKPRGGALPVADLSSSMTATIAILAALYDRQRTGKGRVIDVALADTVMSWSYVWGEGLTPSKLDLGAALPRVSREVQKRAKGKLAEALAGALADDRAQSLADKLGATVRGSDLFRRFERVRLHALPHYGTYRCKDGAWISIGIVDEDKFWRALCQSIGLGELARIKLPGRVLMAPNLRPLVTAAIARKTRDEWMALLDLEAVPVTPVLRLDEAIDDPQLRSRRPDGATPAMPPPLTQVVDARPPRLGEHTVELLARSKKAPARP